MELNLDTREDPCPTFITELLTSQEEMDYLKLLLEYKDNFSWSYKEIPSLTPRVALHYLGTKKEALSIKQS